jgi:asparagine synthase (glutamine-hydrolysing)
MSLNQWRLRGVLACSVGPWVPSGIMSSLRDISAGDGRLASSKSLISPEWQANLAGASELRPASIDGSRRTRWKMLQQRESGNYRKGTLARWGVDERDPTGDRRLAEFCLSLPPEQLLKGGVNRYLARSALADRLPADVINAPRGYQFADWYENVDRAGLLRLVDRASAGAGDVLDLPRLRALAESWPLDGRWDSLAVIYAYRLTLLRGLAAGAFAAEVS